MTILIMK